MTLEGNDHLHERPQTGPTNAKVLTTRVRLLPIISVAIGVAYMILFLALEAGSGVDYTDIGKTTDSIVDAVVTPMTVITVALIVVTTVLGWWRPVMTDSPRVGPRWAIAIPVIVLVGAIAGFDWANVSEIPASYLVPLAAGTAMVGIGEELGYRGLGLAGLRQSMPEWQVWLVSTTLFSLLHSVNLFLGQGIGATITQLFFSFVIGSVFYACRRVTGTLIVPMVLHGVWDFGSISKLYEPASGAIKADASQLAGAIVMISLLVAVALTAIAGRQLLTTPANVANSN